jgi:MoaA/NifB/PqqE/SkfB family radical SAM enzyme
MPGAQLPLKIVLDLLDDCKTFGINNIRLYGGEPLLYKDLVRVVEHSVALGLHPWLTTNGILLKEKIDDEAFVEGKLEAPKHLVRTVHELYFEPKHEEFRSRTIWSLSNAFTSAFKELEPIPQFKATAKRGEFLEARFSQSF